MRTAALAAALGLALSFAPPRLLALPDFALSVRAVPGQTYEGTITDPGQVHEFVLDDFTSGEDAVLTISLKAAKGSALEPDLDLYGPADDETPLSLGAHRKDRPTSVAVAKFPLANQGRHRLYLNGKGSTSGGYLLKVTAYPAKSFKGESAVGAENGAFGFTAPAEALVTFKIAPGAGLAPIFDGIGGPPCTAPAILPGTKPGTGTLRVPASGQYTVSIDGDGGTEGAFKWSAKVKAAKPSKIPVRVNGGSPAFPGPGPAPAAAFLAPGQDVQGFASDGTAFVWREVKQTGGGGSQYRNSLHSATMTGGGVTGLENNLGTDQFPPARCVAVGPTHAVVVTDGELTASSRAGGPGALLDASVGSPLRVLADGTAAYTLDGSDIAGYDLGGDGSTPIAGTIGTMRDMALAGSGIVYVHTTSGGDLEVRQTETNGDGDDLVANLGADPGFDALAARGTDVYVAFDDGSGGSQLRAMSTCEPGTSTLLASLTETPARAMAVDDQNLYVLVDEGTDGSRILQIPRGGGVHVVLVRGNPDGGFVIDQDEIVAHGGYVQFLATVDGVPTFLRVKRR